MILSEIYGCMLTGKFDFSVSSTAAKWSTPQEAFKYSTLRFNKTLNEFAYPYSVIDTRLRIRGSGKVLVYRYESEAGKDFELIGRVTAFTTETEG